MSLITTSTDTKMRPVLEHVWVASLGHVRTSDTDSQFNMAQDELTAEESETTDVTFKILERANERILISKIHTNRIMQSGGTGGVQTMSEKWLRALINNAMKQEEIIGGIKLLGCDSIADRLEYLYSLPIDGPDEKPIVFESLHTFALFIVDHTALPEPRVSISPDGLVNAEWDQSGCDVITMEFLPSSEIRFVRLPRSSEFKNQKYVAGVLPLDDIEGIRQIVNQLRG